MFKDQPKGLFALALANTGERFGYYTMLAIFLLFIQAKFGFSAAVSTQIYSIFLAAVYFMPLFGGMLADKIGYENSLTTGSASLSLQDRISQVKYSCSVHWLLSLSELDFSRETFRLWSETFMTTLNILRREIQHSAFSTWPSTSVRCSLLLWLRL